MWVTVGSLESTGRSGEAQEKEAQRKKEAQQKG